MANASMTGRTAAAIRARLLELRGQIERGEAKLTPLYSERTKLLLEAREVDPATDKPKVIWSDLSEWTGVTKVALYKAVRKDR